MNDIKNKFSDFSSVPNTLFPNPMAPNNVNLSETHPIVPVRNMDTREKPSLHTSGYSVMSQKKLENDPFRCKNIIPKSNLCFLMPATVTSTLLSPNSKRPFSAMDAKIKNLSVEETREQYWGNII